MLEPINIFTNKFLSFLLPKYCVHCHAFGNYLCQECYEKITFINTQLCPECRHPTFDGNTHPGCKTSWGIDGILCATMYSGPIQSLIKHIKYKPYASKAHEEVGLILTRYFTDQEPFFPADSTLIPIPLHPRKQKERGFNQSELIAESLSSMWQFPVETNILKKKEDTRDQVSLPKKERLYNVSSAFCIHPDMKQYVTKKNFILVDDVTTTGSTLKSCAKILKRNKAEHVWGVALARD